MRVRFLLAAFICMFAFLPSLVSAGDWDEYRYVVNKPIEIADGLTLLYYHVSVPGDSFMIGELRNDTDREYDVPLMEFSFRDSGGNLLKQEVAPAELATIKPHATTPFRLGLPTEDLALFHPSNTLNVSVCGWGATDMLQRWSTLDLSMENVSGTIDERHYWRGTVDVRNNGDDEIDGAQLLAFGRDAEGMIPVFWNGYVNGPILPGTFSRVELSFLMPVDGSGPEFQLHGYGNNALWDCEPSTADLLP